MGRHRNLVTQATLPVSACERENGRGRPGVAAPPQRQQDTIARLLQVARRCGRLQGPPRRAAYQRLFDRRMGLLFDLYDEACFLRDVGTGSSGVVRHRGMPGEHRVPVDPHAVEVQR
eukprot:9478541-Pyramimonas_sp.AAC.1